jgi:NAD(P)-dependent dehydrogenase (short-subunit alcohol dehydrogenase family)
LKVGANCVIGRLHRLVVVTAKFYFISSANNIADILTKSLSFGRSEDLLWIERTPMERLGVVDELNNLAVFLAGDASSYMTDTDIIIDVSCLDVETFC